MCDHLHCHNGDEVHTARATDSTFFFDAYGFLVVCNLSERSLLKPIFRHEHCLDLQSN